MRIALGLEYDGSGFLGWQRQDDLKTVQADVESALTKVADEPISVFCAGRTDAGVHACEQVIHFDTTKMREEKAWIFGVNTHLPRAISVKWAKQVSCDFHARFCAVSRHYQYVIFNKPHHPALFRDYVSWYRKPLDVDLMQRGAQFLLGEHDFSSFRSADCQSRSPFRNVNRIDIVRKEDMIYLDIQANAFLHHMVRNIVGTLFCVGEGRKEPCWVSDVLQARDRRCAGPTAPPQGLFLVKVDYKDKL